MIQSLDSVGLPFCKYLSQALSGGILGLFAKVGAVDTHWPVLEEGGVVVICPLVVLSCEFLYAIYLNL